MESMRDVNRVMEREIAKGSSPLKLDHIEFGEYSYQEITSKEKLLEVLSYLLRIGDFSQYTGKAVIKRYANKLKPEYNGDVYLETVRCYFTIPEENLEKCRYTYQGNETYAFLLSDKYILGLYTHCLVARKEAASTEVQVEGFTEKEYGMVRLENVGDVLFQALLFDNVKFEVNRIYVDLYTIYH